jgi:hypothetical protein
LRFAGKNTRIFETVFQVPCNSHAPLNISPITHGSLLVLFKNISPQMVHGQIAVYDPSDDIELVSKKLLSPEYVDFFGKPPYPKGWSGKSKYPVLFSFRLSEMKTQHLEITFKLDWNFKQLSPANDTIRQQGCG